MFIFAVGSLTSPATLTFAGALAAADVNWLRDCMNKEPSAPTLTAGFVALADATAAEVASCADPESPIESTPILSRGLSIDTAASAPALASGVIWVVSDPKRTLALASAVRAASPTAAGTSYPSSSMRAWNLTLASGDAAAIASWTFAIVSAGIDWASAPT